MPSPDETLPPPPSSTSGSPVSDDQLLLEQAESWLDLKVADHARLMADNQRVLDQTLAQNKAHVDRQARFQETLMPASTPSSSAAPPPQDEMVINIRSPVTHNHPAPPAPAPVAQPAPVVVQPAPVQPAPVAAPAKSGMGTLGKLVTGAAILAGGGGLGALATYALSRPSTTEVVVPAPVNTNTTRGFIIEFPK